MSDDLLIPSSPAGRRWALIFGGVSVVYFMAMIGVVVWMGRADKELLSSALHMSFLGIYVVLTGCGFGAAIQLAAAFKK